jgi:hypothetical protein
MQNRGTNRILSVGAVFGLTFVLACDGQPEVRDTTNTPPVVNDNVNITPPPTPPIQEEPTPEPPTGDPVNNPDQYVDQDCDALPLPNGTVLNCTAQLGTAQSYCDNVYVGGDANNVNFELVSSCGACDPIFFNPPAGAAECIEDITGNVIDQPIDLEESTCKTCHAPNEYDGLNSIENPHPWVTVDCVDCHGGDGTATNQVFAHVCPPPEVGNRNQQVLDTRAFFLSFSTAGVQFLADYNCNVQGGGTKTVSPLDWLAFINPGDIRAARTVSAETGQQRGCGKCHGETAVGEDGTAYISGGDVVTNVSRSVMGQATGLNSGTRHGIGALNKFADRQQSNYQTDWGTQADLGATDVSDPTYNPQGAARVVGQVNSLTAAQVYTGQNFRYNQTYTADAVNNSLNLFDTNRQNYPNGIYNDVAEQLFQEVLNQACTGCHLQNNYNNNRYADYRSNGCSACHFETAYSARSSSKDPNVDKYEPIDPDNLTPGELTHVRDHRVRNVTKTPGSVPGLATVVQGIADSNCIICHEGSNRTVAQYHGYRLDQNQDLVNNNFYPTQNTVTFTLHGALFNQNNNFNNRNINQWILDEVWQADVTNILNQNGQDQTPEDVHHEAGMGCIDCHGTGSTHGRGEIYSRMKVQTHENDTLCETCHGTVHEYAQTDGTHILDQGGYPLTNTYVELGVEGNVWLVSKMNGSTHYIPQSKDIVDATTANGNGKQYPPGSARPSEPLYNTVASYAMGVYEEQQDLSNGWGPYQPNSDPNVFQLEATFGHSDGNAYGTGYENQGMECYTCHAAWQNNCVGCHLDAFYDNNPNNFFYSFVNGERIYFNFNANFVYQNPIDFMMGINDRGKISPYQGLHRFFSYQDLNNNTSNRISYGDRNGLGNDPQLRLVTRNNLPALQNQPFVPHSIRGRYTEQEVGTRGCLDCHFPNANQVFMTDQYDQTYDITAIIANQENYANSIPFQVNMAYGLGSNLWLFDADGNAVVDTNNTPAFDLDRIVEAQTGVTNSSSNHPLLDPQGMNPNYVQFADTNGAQLSRPLTAQVLNRLEYINNIAQGITNTYYYNLVNDDPANTGYYVYFLTDRNYFGAN